MSAYDNPSRNIITRKLAENATGPDVGVQWALVKGKIKGLGASDEVVELTVFTRLDVANLKQIKAGGAVEIIAGLAE